MIELWWPLHSSDALVWWIFLSHLTGDCVDLLACLCSMGVLNVGTKNTKHKKNGGNSHISNHYPSKKENNQQNYHRRSSSNKLTSVDKSFHVPTTRARSIGEDPVSQRWRIIHQTSGKQNLGHLLSTTNDAWFVQSTLLGNVHIDPDRAHFYTDWPKL